MVQETTGRSTRAKRRSAGLALIVAAATLATACGSDEGPTSTEDSVTTPSETTATGTEGEGTTGGTLIVAGGPDVLYLDPAAAYSAGDYQIQRSILRGLFDYMPSDDGVERTTPQADIATEIPTVENGGISADGTTYTITLRDGVIWNAPSGERPVVAGDVVLGVKRMCNPVQGSAVRNYFTATIVGLDEYCSAFGEVAPDIESIRAYIEGHEIEGVTAVDDSTVKFTLVQPASDFTNILALSRFSAPQPVEYLDYLPDSPELRQHTIANGPYMITEYVPDQRYVLDRNPTWDAATDPLRKAYVDSIEITLGQEPESVFQQIIAGTVDMQFGETIVPTNEIPALVAAEDDRLSIVGDGSINPYVVINTLSPNEDSAFQNVLVRQALNFAVNKEAVQQILGGPTLADLAFHILPPQVPGSVEMNPLDVPAAGDTAKAKEMLAEAGYPDGVDVKLLYSDEQEGRNLATVLQQDLGAAGFNVELVFAGRNEFYGEWLLNAEVTRAGGWDIAAVTWYADYLSGRAYMSPMLDGRGYNGGSPNYGAYNNDEVNAAIDAAVSAATPEEANELWAEADRLATIDAAWVPITFTKTPTLHGERVKGFAVLAPPRNGDFTNVWVDG